MSKAGYKILLFDGTQRALRAERLLLAQDLSVTTIPVPRHLSSDCGIAIRFESSAEPVVLQTLADNNLTPRGVHPL